MRPRKDQLVVFVGPAQRRRYFSRWSIKVSKARGETYTPPAELLDLHMLPLAQCFAFRLWKRIPPGLVANTDHTSKIIRHDEKTG